MDSSFLHKVNYIVTFCRNELFYSATRYLFSVKYISFLEKCFIELKTVFVNTDQQRKRIVQSNLLRRNKLRLYGRLRLSGLVLASTCVETQFIASYKVSKQHEFDITKAPTDFHGFLCLCNCVVAIYTDFYKTKGLVYP